MFLFELSDISLFLLFTDLVYIKEVNNPEKGVAFARQRFLPTLNLSLIYSFTETDDGV